MSATWRTAGVLTGLLVTASCRALPPSDAVAPEASAVELDLAGAELGPPGDVLEANIPLLGGETVALSHWRGRVLLLELSSPERPGWHEAGERWAALVRELGEDRLAVVTVAARAEARPSSTAWDRSTLPLTIGWDPQGALMLRLGVTELPTRIVLDRQGRIVSTVAGSGPERMTAVERTVRTAAEEG